jgi:hypothetical protein
VAVETSHASTAEAANRGLSSRAAESQRVREDAARVVKHDSSRYVVVERLTFLARTHQDEGGEQGNDAQDCRRRDAR